MPLKSRAEFAFVANLKALRGGGAVLLATGHVLRRARDKEIETIKKHLKELLTGPQFFMADAWERRLFQGTGIQELLPESEWRYYVIAFHGNNSTIDRIREASEIAPVELEILFTTVNGGRGVVWHADHVFQAVQEAQHNDDFFVDFSAGDAAQVKRVRLLLESTAGEVMNINWFISQLSALKGFPRRSTLRFLGYFAVLESLLTHPPRPTDPYDSITRQVKKKLTLLDHRWSRRIDYSPFGDTPAETVWGKMYAYRSAVAHGGTPDFNSLLSVLRNHATALRLLQETAKAVVRYALEEPLLVLDLRDC
jgi:hypothetical protein